MRVKVLVFIFILIFALSVNVFATTESNNSILNGIDVSDWQGSINFNQVKQSGIDIVYIKATQGTNIIDTYFKTNYNNAKLNG